MTKILVIIAAGFLLIAGTFIMMSSRTRNGPCRTGGDLLTISEVTFGEFMELVPASGEMKDGFVVAKIHEFYLDRVKVDLST